MFDVKFIKDSVNFDQNKMFLSIYYIDIIIFYSWPKIAEYFSSNMFNYKF